MKICIVTLEQMLAARERRAEIQSRLLRGAMQGQCLVCLTLNIAGDVKRTPMTRMLFDHGIHEMDALGFSAADSLVIDEPTGSEAFWLLNEDGTKVKTALEAVEDSFPAARLYDFDVIMPGGAKLSRKESRKCLICDSPAAECARSRRHGLEQIRKATDDLLADFCASKLALAAHDSLLNELYTTPKPGLVDLNNCGSHSDMDLDSFEKSAAALIPYFEDAARMGMENCNIKLLRGRGIKAEEEMFAATGGVNTHKGLIYSMGLLMAGMGKCLSEKHLGEKCPGEKCLSKDEEESCTGYNAHHIDDAASGSEKLARRDSSLDLCIEYAAELAREDAEDQLKKSMCDPETNGGAVYKTYGAKGATGEAAAGFPNALYCLSRLKHYREISENLQDANHDRIDRIACTTELSNGCEHHTYHSYSRNKDRITGSTDSNHGDVQHTERNETDRDCFAITFNEAAALALCDCMMQLEDTNLLHRGGRAGLDYVKQEAARISAMPESERIAALRGFDAEMIARGLSPGGSADMLALSFLLDRWETILL